MTNEYYDALADHMAGKPRRFDEGFTYKLTRDQLELEQNPRKAAQDNEKAENELTENQRTGNVGAAVIFLAVAAGVVWVATSIWAWFTVKFKPVDAAIQSAFDVHPWLENYYFGVAIGLLGPPMVVYEQTRSWLRWSAWFPWPAASKPIAWIAAILSACIILRLLTHLLIKWKWLRWALPLMIFGPLVLGVALRYLQRS